MNRFSMRSALLEFPSLSAFVTAESFAQWSDDPAVNNPICTASGDQTSPKVGSVGAEGAILAWWDGRSATGSFDLFAQRIDSSGKVKWMTNGSQVCSVEAQKHNPTITGDGAGGAIIAWDDEGRGYSDIYAQRINGAGVIQWPASGVPVCTSGQVREPV